MSRKVLKDFTFSNGLTVPAGTFLAAPAYHIHNDDASIQVLTGRLPNLPIDHIHRCSRIQTFPIFPATGGRINQAPDGNPDQQLSPLRTG